MVLTFITEYLDPFIDQGAELKGFRSVLKLTPSHPRNPKYKYVSSLVNVCDW